MDIRINITMPKEFLAAVDETAKIEHRNRSELIREALRTYLAGKSFERRSTVGKSTTFEIDSLTGTLRNFFAKEPDVILGYLFGSQVEMKAGPLSDVDIAVLLSDEVKQTKYPDKVAYLTERLISLLGTDLVDVVILNSADPLLLFEAVVRGVLVFERKSSLSTELKIKAIKRRLDSGRFRELDRIVIEKFLKDRGKSL
jgi:predicted nucleotidyltransferase